jgi:hypothetical protein
MTKRQSTDKPKAAGTPVRDGTGLRPTRLPPPTTHRGRTFRYLIAVVGTALAVAATVVLLTLLRSG